LEEQDVPPPTGVLGAELRLLLTLLLLGLMKGGQGGAWLGKFHPD
jgi:hypothetical protein